jgi:hypothetical protein
MPRLSIGCPTNKALDAEDIIYILIRTRKRDEDFQLKRFQQDWMSYLMAWSLLVLLNYSK